MKMRIRSSGSVTFSSRALSFSRMVGESVLLNQKQQALFGLEIVIKPRQ